MNYKFDCGTAAFRAFRVFDQLLKLGYDIPKHWDDSFGTFLITEGRNILVVRTLSVFLAHPATECCVDALIKTDKIVPLPTCSKSDNQGEDVVNRLEPVLKVFDEIAAKLHLIHQSTLRADEYLQVDKAKLAMFSVIDMIEERECEEKFADNVLNIHKQLSAGISVDAAVKQLSLLIVGYQQRK